MADQVVADSAPDAKTPETDILTSIRAARALASKSSNSFAEARKMASGDLKSAVDQAAQKLTTKPDNPEHFEAYKKATKDYFDANPANISDILPEFSMDGVKRGFENVKKFGTALNVATKHAGETIATALATAPYSPIEAAKGVGGGLLALGSDIFTTPLEAGSKLKEATQRYTGNTADAAETAAQKLRDQALIERDVQKLKPASEAGGSAFEATRTVAPLAVPIAGEFISGARKGVDLISKAIALTPVEEAATVGKVLLGTRPLAERVAEKTAGVVGSTIGGAVGAPLGTPGSIAAAMAGRELAETAASKILPKAGVKYPFKTLNEVETAFSDAQRNIAGINAELNDLGGIEQAANTGRGRSLINELRNVEAEQRTASAAKQEIDTALNKATAAKQPNVLSSLGQTAKEVTKGAVQGAGAGAAFGIVKGTPGEDLTPYIAGGMLYGSALKAAEGAKNAGVNVADWVSARRKAQTIVTDPKKRQTITEEQINKTTDDALAAKQGEAASVAADPANGVVKMEIAPGSKKTMDIPSGTEVVDLVKNSESVVPTESRQGSPMPGTARGREDYRYGYTREEGVKRMAPSDLPQFSKGKPLESLAKTSEEVESSQIDRLGYEPKTGHLYVKFRGQTSDGFDNYILSNVSEAEYKALRDADSIGSHFNKNLKFKKPTAAIDHTYEQLIGAPELPSKPVPAGKTPVVKGKTALTAEKPLESKPMAQEEPSVKAEESTVAKPSEFTKDYEIFANQVADFSGNKIPVEIQDMIERSKTEPANKKSEIELEKALQNWFNSQRDTIIKRGKRASEIEAALAEQERSLKSPQGLEALNKDLAKQQQEAADIQEGINGPKKVSQTKEMQAADIAAEQQRIAQKTADFNAALLERYKEGNDPIAYKALKDQLANEAEIAKQKADLINKKLAEEAKNADEVAQALKEPPSLAEIGSMKGIEAQEQRTASRKSDFEAALSERDQEAQSSANAAKLKELLRTLESKSKKTTAIQSGQEAKVQKLMDKVIESEGISYDKLAAEREGKSNEQWMRDLELRNKKATQKFLTIQEEGKIKAAKSAEETRKKAIAEKEAKPVAEVKPVQEENPLIKASQQELVKTEEFNKRRLNIIDQFRKENIEITKDVLAAARSLAGIDNPREYNFLRKKAVDTFTKVQEKESKPKPLKGFGELKTGKFGPTP